MILPLMPKATAVWLIERTGLTFEQIAEFCGMHPLEVQSIADGEISGGIKGYDPIVNGQLSAEEIKRCEQDPKARLQIFQQVNFPQPQRVKGTRYTPIAKRIDRPDAIAFLLKNFPQLSDLQIVRLLGTTKETIEKVRNRTHWNSQNIKPRDPVTIGLCKQAEVNAAVAEANKAAASDQEKGEIFSLGKTFPEEN